jgi:hypothetical protein
MRVNYAFACDVAVRAPSGKLNVAGIMNELYSTEYPFVREQVSIVVGFEASQAEAGQEKRIRVALHEPDGAEIAAKERDYTVTQPTYPGRPRFVSSTWDFLGVQFPAPDHYEFRVLVNGDEKATIPLYVYAPIS